jgi:hypothetical protein
MKISIEMKNNCFGSNTNTWSNDDEISILTNVTDRYSATKLSCEFLNDCLQSQNITRFVWHSNSFNFCYVCFGVQLSQFFQITSTMKRVRIYWNHEFRRFILIWCRHVHQTKGETQGRSKRWTIPRVKENWNMMVKMSESK